MNTLAKLIRKLYKMKLRLLLLFCFLIVTVNYAQEADTNLKSNQKMLRFNTNNNKEVALRKFANEFKIGKGVSFQLYKTTTDRKGVTHERFQQYFKGIKVENGIAIAHSLNNSIQLINGELYNVLNTNTTPLLNNNAALIKATNFVNATQYLWEDAAQSNILKYSKPQGELIYFSNVETKEAVLAYKFDIYATMPVSRQIIYVDANSGDILFTDPIIKSCNHKEHNYNETNHFSKINNTLVSGTAATRYSGTRTIETTFNGTSYVLRDTTRGNGISTYNCQDTNNYQNVDFTDNDNNWTAAEHNNFFKDDGALDAHWGAEVTYDFWDNIFSRNSFDDEGAEIKSYVHFGNFDNAYWNGVAMTYGDGSSLDILTALDICGHEIGHAVCTHTANLVYQNESGALNEAFSDIWGACIEQYGKTGSLNPPFANAVWTIGEDTGSSLRSMKNPNIFGDPDTYGGTYWYTGAGDNGGVHINSGVLNHWFYIVTEGESGTNNAPSPDTYNVTGIGMIKSSEIAYLAERDYLTPNATYADARAATIEVVNTLYCANSPEAVTVTNAWYAVNVGNQYNAMANDLSINAIQENETIPCEATAFATNIVLKNQGTNSVTTASIQYTVDGGAPNTISWTGNLMSCEEVNVPLTLNGLTRGAHTLTATATIASDGNSANNTRTTTFFINDSGTVNVTNTFSAAADELIVYNDEGTQPWIRTTRTFGSMGTGINTAYMINNTGNYPDLTKTYLVSQCYDLSTLLTPQISFLMKYDLEVNWDIVYVEYTTDFGANWNVLGTMGSNWYNSDRTLASSGGNDCYNCPGAQWTGTNTTNTTYSYSLASLNSETNVIFRIVFHSDEAVNQLGVNIDDFLISGTLSSNSFQNANSIAIYPVPSKGIFTLNFNTATPKKVEVFDLTGKKITSIDTFTTSNETVLNLTAAANGVYFVKIETEQGKTVKRIIKE
ncbi:M4 family metallopeptidase [Flavobacterium sp.]|uniref:M4 family metallopeptidase n=1 Tax=Flavobacterium sp. TaxID=239 RepID=UPI00352975F2